MVLRREDFPSDMNDIAIQRGLDLARADRAKGIENIKQTIAELEALPPWQDDPLGICVQSKLNMARMFLARLEESESANPS